jgi:hypothetical protein
MERLFVFAVLKIEQSLAPKYKVRCDGMEETPSRYSDSYGWTCVCSLLSLFGKEKEDIFLCVCPCAP